MISELFFSLGRRALITLLWGGGWVITKAMTFGVGYRRQHMTEAV